MSVGLCDKRTTTHSGLDPQISYTAVRHITQSSHASLKVLASP